MGAPFLRAFADERDADCLAQMSHSEAERTCCSLGTNASQRSGENMRIPRSSRGDPIPLMTMKPVMNGAPQCCRSLTSVKYFEITDFLLEQMSCYSDHG